MTTIHHWTAGELDALRLCYPHQVTRDIANTLGVKVKLVYAQANRMGLRKSAAFQATSKSGRILKGGKLSQATQFVPGQKPWNAGTHYVAGGRSAETRFKSGDVPHTWQPVGAYRVTPDGDLQIKWRDCPGANHLRWKPVSRLVWEAYHGPIPDGHIVVFKPGTRTVQVETIRIEQLECISRGEHARRNHPRNKHPEYARLVALKGAITRQVNRIIKDAESTQP